MQRRYGKMVTSIVMKLRKDIRLTCQDISKVETVEWRFVCVHMTYTAVCWCFLRRQSFWDYAIKSSQLAVAYSGVWGDICKLFLGKIFPASIL